MIQRDVICSANKLTLGSSITITGSLCSSHAAQNELHPESIEIIGTCDSVVSTTINYCLLSQLMCIYRNIHSRLMAGIH